MPTLPNSSLFDKDLSLRSPFPRHLSVIPQATSSTESSEANQERPQHSARLNFSQIKRPVPLKALPSPPISNAQPSQSIPHSLRNLLHLTAPSTAKWTTVDSQLNRIYNASPMPKIIDQTYSSLDVSARPQSHTVVIHSPPSSKEVETFVQSPAEGHLSLRFRVSDHISDSAPDTDKPDERDIRTSPLSQFDIVVGEQSSLQFEESDSPQENMTLDVNLYPQSNPAEGSSKEGHGSLSKYNATSRKRKSKASQTQGRSKYRKTDRIAQDRIQSAIIEAKPTNESTLSSSPQRRNEDRLSCNLEQASEMTFAGKSVDREPEAEHRSEVRRSRMSVGQWFKGSLWDAPHSAKRERRPPSQWWIPSSIFPKRKRKKKAKGYTRKDAVDTTKPATSRSAVSEVTVCHEQEEPVTRIIMSKEIYDFSDG